VPGGVGPTVGVTASPALVYEEGQPNVLTVTFTTEGDIPEGGVVVVLEGPPRAITEFDVNASNPRDPEDTISISGPVVSGGSIVGTNETAGAVVFRITEPTATIQIAPFQDGVAEGPEPLTFNLRDGELYNVNPAASSVTVTIDDVAPGGGGDDTPLQVGLFDANSDNLIANLSEGTEIQARALIGRNVTIVAFVPDESPLFGQVGSVFMNLNNGQVTRREGIAPYALFGDLNGDYFGNNLTLPSGSNTISLDVFSRRNRGRSTLLETVAINFSIVDDQGSNRPPIALDDSFTTILGTPLTGNVALNDSDPDGDDLIFALETETSNGTLSFEADGSFSYSPNEGFSGLDSFTYTVSDGEFVDTAAVDILINGAAASSLQIGLYNADNDELIQPLQNGDTLLASTLPTQNLSIAAFVPDNSPLADQLESIRLTLNNGQVRITENVEPYALFGDRNGDLRGGSLPLGENTITLELFDQDRARGQLLGVVSLDFTIA
jgi:hypothetical protein